MNVCGARRKKEHQADGLRSAQAFTDTGTCTTFQVHLSTVTQQPVSVTMRIVTKHVHSPVSSLSLLAPSAPLPQPLALRRTRTGTVATRSALSRPCTASSVSPLSAPSSCRPAGTQQVKAHRAACFGGRANSGLLSEGRTQGHTLHQRASLDPTCDPQLRLALGGCP